MLARAANLLQANAARILTAATLALILLALALRSSRIDAELTNWLQLSPKLEQELKYLEAQLADGSIGSSQLLLQAPNIQTPTSNQLELSDEPNPDGVLSVHALMVHLEALAIAGQVNVDLFGVTWSLKDICFAPTLPDLAEGYNVAHLLEGLMPCAIKTPLDCFWEGAKLLGPDQPIRLRDSLPPFKWTSANPEVLIEGLRHTFPHAAFPYADLLQWMQRLGIGSGYQHKPCLDPSDAHCPETAPNRRSRHSPDLGAYLARGCRGIAANQMHWRREEILGGPKWNSTGHLVQAHALQSIIQLMGDHEMFDYWRKTEKVQDLVGHWSPEKAAQVLAAWQARFKQELAEFAASSPTAKSYKLYAVTAPAKPEPFKLESLIDLGSFQVSFALMSSFVCLVFPNLGDSLIQSKLLALVASLLVGLTFVASLGLSSFLSLPLNLATTQILPPWALYYGFSQLTTIVQIFAKAQHDQAALDHLTSHFLSRIWPILKLDTGVHIIAFGVAGAIPIAATRTFAIQALLHIGLANLASFLIFPPLFTIFLKKCNTPQNRSRIIHCNGISSSSAKKDYSTSIEDHIFSRINDDLKNIRADSRNPNNIDFSAELDANGLRTSFKLSASTAPRDESAKLSRERISMTGDHHHQRAYNNNDTNNLNLPDLIAGSFDKSSLSAKSLPLPKNSEAKENTAQELNEAPSDQIPTKQQEELPLSKSKLSIQIIYSKIITKNKLAKTTIYLIGFIMHCVLLSHSPYVNHGLQMSDIIAQGSEEYESFLLQENFFHTYNVFAITKGNFDYPTNQKLLYDYNQALEDVEGVIRDEHTSRFWLIRFRNWLLELQQQFDKDKQKAAINSEGWTQDASNAAKLAFKLLAQTGRSDNPINKSIVETNRLVDANGIINPKAFYYYLYAWVINDPFTYATSEASFKPEYKADKWKFDPDILKIEKPQPITFAQIPFLMNLPSGQESYNKMMKFRNRSQAFEKQNLPNFPTGMPFIFWEQYAKLDIMLLVASAITVASFFIYTGLISLNFGTAAIILISVILAITQLYGLIGLTSIPLNNVLVAVLIATIGTSASQTIYLITHFDYVDGELTSRTCDTIKHRWVTVIQNLILLLICAFTFQSSRIAFISRLSYLFYGLVLINCFNAFLLTPTILSSFGTHYKPVDKREHHATQRSKEPLRLKTKHNLRVNKKRTFPTVQSEISLSTISEEPQSEGYVHDLKFDFSIRCY